MTCRKVTGEKETIEKEGGTRGQDVKEVDATGGKMKGRKEVLWPNKSENYRPVSLTSVICKLLERVIKDHLVDILVKNKLINPSQHGVLKARSCLTNRLCFFWRCHKMGTWGITSRYNLLRFKKAFDKVSHQRLLLKLKAHGVWLNG